jgi:hypothetical protein
MRRRKLSLVLCIVSFVALAVIVGSPFAEDVDDAFVVASLFVGIPLMLISSAVVVVDWWQQRIKDEPPRPRSRWRKVFDAVRSLPFP